MALRNDVHRRIGKNLADRFHGAPSEPLIGGKERQHLGENVFGRTDLAFRKKIIKTHGLLRMLVLWIR
jgi:hypothetical protein